MGDERESSQINLSELLQLCVHVGVMSLLRSNSGHAEKASKREAGGRERLPLLLFGLCIVLCVLIVVPVTPRLQVRCERLAYCSVETFGSGLR